MHLAPYDFTIYYRKGKLNPADGPSRRPDYISGKGPWYSYYATDATLENKLATVSRGADEQVGKDRESFNRKSGRSIVLQA